MTSPTPFATTTDVQSSWRTLTAEQSDYADLLLLAAAVWIYGKLPGIAPDSVGAHVVSVDVVRAALQRDIFEGAPNGRITRGNRSDEWSTTRKASVEELSRTLQFTEFHLNLLGLFQPTGPVSSMGSQYGSGPDPIILFGINSSDSP